MSIIPSSLCLHCYHSNILTVDWQYARVVSKTNRGTGDGIVLDQARLGNEKRNTLTHEIGHWLGLEHTFGDVGSLCTLDDGLLDTTRTSGSSRVVYECEQVACSGSTPGRIENHMSVRPSCQMLSHWSFEAKHLCIVFPMPRSRHQRRHDQSWLHQ